MNVVISSFEKIRKQVKLEKYSGEIIFSNLDKLDLSDENLFKVSRVILNKEKKITPNYYSKTCATTGLIIFILKDILEYVGLISDKKTLPSQMLKLNNIFVNKSEEIKRVPTNS